MSGSVAVGTYYLVGREKVKRDQIGRPGIRCVSQNPYAGHQFDTPVCLENNFCCAWVINELQTQKKV